MAQYVWNAFHYGDVGNRRFGGDHHLVASWAIGKAVYSGITQVDDIVDLLKLNPDGAGYWWYRRTDPAYGASNRSSVGRMYRDIQRKIDTCLAAMRSQILDASQARFIIQELYDRAIEGDWHGRTAAIDRKVYIAHCRLAIEAGHIADYGASIRQLATEANVGKDTVCKANARLLALGAIKHSDRVDGRSSRWRLVRSWGDKLLPTDLGIEEVVACHDFVPPSHPAFAHGSGLHYATWLALDRDPMTARDITEALNRSGKNAIRQTRHRLQQLEDAGLARVGDNGGWYRIGSKATLEAIALERGMTKRMNARRTRYKAESREHTARLALGKIIVHQLKRGSATDQELAAILEVELPRIRETLDDMRSRDYAARLPDGRWTLAALADPNQMPIDTGHRSLETLGLQIRAELDHGRRTERELAIALTASPAQVREAIDHLRHSGVVWRTRGRTWSLTPDSAETLCPLDLAT